MIMYTCIIVLLACFCHSLLAAPVNVNVNDDQGKVDYLAAELKHLQEEFSSLQNVNKAVSNQNNVVKSSQNEDVQGEKLFQPRGVGWQPLKRVAEEPIPNFQLALKDQTSMKQQIINAVEEHLLEDLQAAQQYGVEPQQILADLRLKNKNL